MYASFSEVLAHDLCTHIRLQAAKDEVKKLKAQLSQRDNEIAILVNMVKAAKSTAAAQAALQSPTPSASASGGGLPSIHPSLQSSQSFRVPTPTAFSAAPVGVMLANGATVSEDVLKDKDKAFEIFKDAYPKSDVIEENKKVLREKYDAAKATAERVNRAREETNRLKSEIERRRVEKAMASIVEGTADGKLEDDEGVEAGLKAAMDTQKAEYKSAFQVRRAKLCNNCKMRTGCILCL
jgi:kinesin family protein 6/9